MSKDNPIAYVVDAVRKAGSPTITSAKMTFTDANAKARSMMALGYNVSVRYVGGER